MSFSNTPPVPPDLDFLIDLCKELQIILFPQREWSSSDEEYEQFRSFVTKVLNSINNAPGKDDFCEDSIRKLLTKIKQILQPYTEYEYERSRYEDLIKEVDRVEFKPLRYTGPPISDFSGTYQDGPWEPEVDQDGPWEPEVDRVLGELSPDEKQHLRCFLLFPHQADVKRREIIHCWIGMGLTDDVLAGERLLAKFAEKHLIQRPQIFNRLQKRYRMPKCVYDRLSRIYFGDFSLSRSLVYSRESWSMLHFRSEKEQEQEPERMLHRRMSLASSSVSVRGENDDLQALLNICQRNLNGRRFKNMSGMQKLKVLYLGRWQDFDLSIYIVVQDVESLKYLKKMKQLVSLSLQGVSGIVKLPNSVYELTQLKVLDLRGCFSLEILPHGIHSLNTLTHLDVSGCPLLHYIPLGITFLTNLQVLEGFIINKEPRRSIKGEDLPCPFSELPKLTQLRKLAILNKRRDFPTAQDFQTFCKMENLSSLKIVWGGISASSSSVSDHQTPSSEDRFPASLKKLNIQAAPEDMVARLLRGGITISDDTNTNECCIEKLYIKGGGLRELQHTYLFVHSKFVRLRYLKHFRIQWQDFTKLFPNLSRFEIHDCPNLDSFPGNAYGVWEQEQPPKG